MMTRDVDRLETVYYPVADLIPFHKNAHKGNVARIRASLRDHSQFKPIVVNLGTFTGRPNEVLCGSHTLFAAREEGWAELAAVTVDVDDDEAARINLVDNPRAGHPEDLGYDEQLLLELLSGLPDLDGTGYDLGDIEALESAWQGAGSEKVPDNTEARKSLAERFGVPPFTVLDARQGYWQERKRAWIGLGIASDEGRSKGLTGSFDRAAEALMAIHGREHKESDGWVAGTSIFDPVLCELLVHWYSTPDSRVLDPFAGGSVRGLVTAHLGRGYIGVDLSADQVEANEKQSAVLAATVDSQKQLDAKWIVGDARNIRDLIPATARFDLMVTCPPYFDLEVYSDNPADLSQSADYQAFLTDYQTCLAAASDRMADNAFAAIVTGVVRDKRGYILDLPADTTRIMENLGWRLYQDAVLVNPVGSAIIRASRGFALRKLTRLHQMVGVYHRGNINTVRTWPSPEVGEIEGDETDTQT